jgi:hypothetical protein
MGEGGRIMTLSGDDTALFWSQLLEFIAEGRVVPVVGQSLLTLEHEGGPVPLYSYLAERLAEKLRLPASELAPLTSLNSIVCRYLAMRGDLEDIYPALKQILVDQDQLPIPAPLTKLASIEPFKLFVTTTFDSLLEYAINQVRFDGRRGTLSFAYSPETAGDLPCRVQDLTGPAVFHLLGKLSAVPQYAVSDEDTLEFVHSLQSETRRPRIVLDELNQRHLLIIGTSVSSWFARFFIRLAKKERLFLARGKTDVVADSAVREDPELVLFLQHFSTRTKIFPAGAAEFVDELHRRWHDRPHRPIVEPPAFRMEPGSVFLSYASEDLRVAEGMKAALEGNGIAVWFDKSGLRGGEDFEALIKRNIEEASIFIPIISYHTLTPARRFFRVEWDHALRVAVRASASQRFIIPIALDDIPRHHEAVPARFRELHWVRLPGGSVTSDFIDLIRKVFREYRKLVIGLT